MKCLRILLSFSLFLIELNMKETIFVPIEVTSNSDQEPLELFASCTHKNKLYTFGGKNSRRELNNRLRCFDIIPQNWTTIEVVDQSILPIPRFGSTMCASESFLYVFGGLGGKNGESLNDFWMFSLELNKWSELSLVNCPSPRHQCTLISSNQERNRLYLYGGRVSEQSQMDNGGYLDDFWTFDCSNKKWTQLLVTNGPGPLSGYGTTVIDDKMIIFGGETCGGVKSNNVHIFDLSCETWLNISYNGCPPSPRNFQATVGVDERFMITFGGLDEEMWELDDIWIFDISTYSWLTAPEMLGETPCPRFVSTISALRDKCDKRQLVIYGGLSEVDPGTNLAVNICNDMFRLDLDWLLSECRLSASVKNDVCGLSQYKSTQCDDCFDC